MTMRFKYFQFLIIASFFSLSQTKAQEIKGDTIYVNAEAEILVRFPAMPGYFNTIPSNAPYNFKTAGNGFTVIAKSENTKPTPLTVSEGGRTHRFILAFKKDINYDNDAELDYDYSTIKKIEDRIKFDQLRKQHEVAAVQETASTNTEAPSNKSSVKSAEEENNQKYLSLTTDAKKNLDQKKYQEAKSLFAQALKVKPGDLYASNQIEKIDEILTEQNKLQEKQKSKDLYNSYMSEGKKSFEQNKLSEAKLAFQQALTVQNNDKEANQYLQKIDDKEKVILANESLENSYNTALQNADQLFQSQKYEEAKTAYQKASAIIKRPWPEDQVKNIDKILSDRAAQESLLKQQQQLQALAEAKKKETEALEKKYSDLIESADQYFQKGTYDKAKEKYVQASNLIDRPWPKEQVSKINSILSDIAKKEQTQKELLAQQEANEKKIRENQALESKYDNQIKMADNYFSNKDYANAKTAYKNALSIINKPWPNEQISNIDKIVANQLALEKAEKLKQEQEAAQQKKYDAALANADKEFDKKNYVNAKKLYMDALAFKQDPYPLERLKSIQALVDEQARKEKEAREAAESAALLKKKYDLALTTGKSFYAKGDYDNAKIAYQQALELKPDEKEPANQLNAIEEQLANAARQKIADGEFNSLITQGDSAVINKNFSLALISYNKALALRPNEYYPAAQVKFIQGELQYQERQRAKELAQKQQDEEDQFRKIIAAADASVKAKDYEKAISEYTDALQLRPDNEYALQRLKISKYQLVKQNIPPDSSSFRPTNPLLLNIINSKFPTQTTPLPYSEKDLARKYKKIDFNTLPPDQLMAPKPRVPKDNSKIFSDMMAQQPHLSFSSTVDKINMITTNIVFEDTLVYIKVLVQNDSKDDFLTGPMMVTWTRKSGNVIRLYPLYLYPEQLPVIQPGKQAYVIYVFKSYVVSLAESISFQMSDRPGRIHLRIDIPGSAYNMENYQRYY